MNDGLSPQTAIEIVPVSGKTDRVIADYIDKTYGANDGEYFILSEQNLDNSERTLKYKIIHLEITPPGGSPYRRNIFFNITNMAL